MWLGISRTDVNHHMCIRVQIAGPEFWRLQVGSEVLEVILHGFPNCTESVKYPKPEVWTYAISLSAVLLGLRY